MAATTLSSTPIDLNSQTTFPLRLGASITKLKEAKKLTTVRYNHAPEFKTPKNVRSSLRRGKGGGEELVLKDGKDELKYSGQNVGGGDRYVLIFKKNGSEKEATLEKLEGCHDFNLVRTAEETDAAKLAARYSQLSFDMPEEDLFGDEDDMEQQVDSSNPWDFRNYLRPGKSKPTKPSITARESGTATPQPQARAATSTPVSRPTKRSEGPLVSQKKRKAPDTSKSNPKRVKAGTEPPEPAPSKPRSDIPKVNVEHKRAPQRRTSVDNSGELILELATPVTEKPPKQPSAMALALSGQLGQGPISLHSAASSPASRIASPNPPRPEGMEEGEEFDLGGLDSSPEAPTTSRKHAEEDYFSGAGEDDRDADADADVEDFELPSPAEKQTQGRKKSVAPTADDDDDLEQQMMAAMGEEDDDDGLEQEMMAAMADDNDAAPTSRPPPAESDEESEEE